MATTATLVRNFRIYTGFSRDPDNDVNNLTLDVMDAVDGNPVFPALPVSLAILGPQQVAFAATMVDARKGGADRTRVKNTAKQVLVDSLVKNALYCQGEARHDLNALLSSGYDVVSTNRAPARWTNLRSSAS